MKIDEDIMINSIQCIDFQDGVSCTSSLFQSKEGFLKLNYSFLSGNVYGIVSDFGCGSWGLVTCLGGRCSKYYTGQILIDGIRTPANNLLSHSAFIGESIFEGVNSKSDILSPQKCIERALAISGQNYTVDEIKSMFSLSDERFERDLNYVSGEIDRISIAVNYALGKDIYCFPWLNEHDICNVPKGVLRILKEHKKIVLIPTSQKRQVKRLADHLIVFRRGKIVFKMGRCKLDG